ncbi:MAG: DUF2029 domain-containing protein [Candidatus Marinimicrobia bacterium]|nr:DUF2029 domain-containing protein [Candidatus Neomarinimicrobiota bacterium]
MKTDEQPARGGPTLWRGFCILGLLALADLGAVLLFLWSPPFIHYTARQFQLFELWSFARILVWPGVILLLIPWARQAAGRGIALGAFLVVGAWYLTPFQGWASPSYDYSAWRNGMISHLTVGHPYETHMPDGTVLRPNYWYPPLLAQSLAVTQQTAEHMQPWLGRFGRVGGHTPRVLTFYAFQASQHTMLLVIFWMLYGFARRCRFDRATAAGLTLGLLTFNVPLYRMFAFHQVNLWMLAGMLGVLLWWDRRPWAAGAAMALGFHMKLYPAIMGLPLLLARRWRVIIWAGIVTLAMALLLMSRSGWVLWHEFLQAISNPMWGSFPRDNSIHGIAKNILKLFDATQYDRELTWAFQALLVAWMLSRIIRRERSWRRAAPPTDTDTDRPARLFMEQSMDTICLSFFVSPLVFEHHYILALPVILWTAATRWPQARGRILTGAALICLVPVYDVCPLAWNRIVGLFLLLAARPVQPPPLSPPDAPSLAAIFPND